MAATRRLSAILAADAAAYSRLMGADEEGTLARLNSHRRDLIDPKIHEHRGRIVKTTGDGVLVEFASVVDAVRCAVEVQRGMAEREPELQDEQRIRFRIGINLGDIIVERGDIFGDGVNVAARLEALAEPGGLCISGTVRDHVGDRLSYPFADTGEQSVKNIAQPVRVYALGAAAVAETPLVPAKPLPRISGYRASIVTAGLAVLALGLAGWWFAPRFGLLATTAPAPLSIVVLPFANLSNDPEQEYFADGITDDLTTDLSHIVNSFVIARTTAFTYKGKPIDVKQIGHDLGVSYVLEGSVRRAGEQVEINAQLIDAESGGHIWAERSNTDRANLANAQSEIVARLARRLELQLLETVSQRIGKERPENADARDLIMRGWAFYNRPRSTSDAAATLNAAQDAFEKALTLDPESADARVGSAWIIGERLANGLSKSRDEDMRHEDELLRQALERDPNAIGGATELGRLRRIQGRLAESKVALQAAVALDANDVGAIAQTGITTLFLGHPDEALGYFEKWLSLDPRKPNMFFTYYWLGLSHLLLNQRNEAADFLNKACYVGPNFPGRWHAHLLLAATLGLEGRVDEAKAALAEWVDHVPKAKSINGVRTWDASFLYMNNPDYAVLRDSIIYAGLRLAGMPEE